MSTWQVNAARSQFSEVLDQADTEGPQIITHHGKERAVVLSIAEYQALKPGKKEMKPDFITFLLSGPKFDFDDFELERDRSLDEREIEFE